MNRTSPYLKAAAVVSTVTLMGAFVAYRAGAFQPAPADAPPESPPAAAPQTASEQLVVVDMGDSAFMYGSKSAPAFTPAPPGTTLVLQPGQQPTPTLESKPPTFMGGSKYITIVPPSGASPIPPPQPPAPKP